jgi:hypothetical protein
VFFVDPPYVQATRNMSAKYRYEMTGADHIRLLERLNRLEGQAMVPGLVAASLPDGWGMLLMDRFFRQQSMTVEGMPEARIVIGRHCSMVPQAESLQSSWGASCAPWFCGRAQDAPSTLRCPTLLPITKKEPRFFEPGFCVLSRNPCRVKKQKPAFYARSPRRRRAIPPTKPEPACSIAQVSGSGVFRFRPPQCGCNTDAVPGWKRRGFRTQT